MLLISFLIVVVFWGAFEQAGGLMNLYTDAKVDRTIGLSWLEEIPAAVFQSLNAGYIIILEPSSVPIGLEENARKENHLLFLKWLLEL